MTILDERPRTAEYAEHTIVGHGFATYSIDVLIEDPSSDLPVWKPFAVGVGGLGHADQRAADQIAAKLAEMDPNRWTDRDEQPIPRDALAYRIIVEVSRTVTEQEHRAGDPRPAKFTSYTRVDLHRD